MKNESYLRYIISDNLSLNKYFRQCKPVSLSDIKRFTLLKVRSMQYSVPDHYYRLGMEYSFDQIKEVSHIFTIGLPRLSDEFLEIHKGIVYVKGNKMNDWQLLLPLIPPLLLVVTKIWKEYGPDIDNKETFIIEHILPSVRYTALPSAYLPEMITFKKENGGFDDLHFHLNGTVETDLAWHDFLKNPEDVYREIAKAYNNANVKEQYEQLTDISDPIDFLNLISIAGRLREWLFYQVFCKRNIFIKESFEDLLKEINMIKVLYKEHPCNKFENIGNNPLIQESVFYIKILNFLSQHPDNNTIAGAFHYYLLILGLCNKLLVQQTDEFGFEQFQKYTSNNLREFSEKTYMQRFLQISGNDLSNIRHIEGRFSPKDELDKNVDIIKKVSKGFTYLNDQQKKTGKPLSTISLVAHFIKKKDSSKNEIRFKGLRHELKKRTNALVALIDTKSSVAKLLTGIDAAASEFDTPPEVFAESYRKLRKCGIEHFTFHAGEDFFHILSGLRAVYEAIDFLDFQAGDRIGHATATGVDVKLWRKNIGERLWMRIENYMDDLVFAYHIITIRKEKSLEHLLPIIALKVEELSSEIYDSQYTIHQLIEAWKLRKEDPCSDLKCNEKDTPRIYEIFKFYHSKKGQEKGSKIIPVDTYDVFQEEDLIKLQHLILRIMHEKQIIIETLPTSNVIIGHHHSFETYHLYNWYKWSKEGIKVPAIVVGTDDAGIFASNIYNEYCHIYCMLVFDKGLSPQDAMEYIERLSHNSKVYAFY